MASCRMDLLTGCWAACREQMNRVQGKLDVLSRENELLKESRSQESYRPPPPACDDPLAEQVMSRLHIHALTAKTAQACIVQ